MLCQFTNWRFHTIRFIYIPLCPSYNVVVYPLVCLCDCIPNHSYPISFTRSEKKCDSQCLLYTDSNYPFGIFKLFWWLIRVLHSGVVKFIWTWITIVVDARMQMWIQYTRRYVNTVFSSDTRRYVNTTYLHHTRSYVNTVHSRHRRSYVNTVYLSHTKRYVNTTYLRHTISYVNTVYSRHRRSYVNTVYLIHTKRYVNTAYISHSRMLMWIQRTQVIQEYLTVRVIYLHPKGMNEYISVGIFLYNIFMLNPFELSTSVPQTTTTIIIPCTMENLIHLHNCIYKLKKLSIELTNPWRKLKISTQDYSAEMWRVV
jgi:hypothetical protein